MGTVLSALLVWLDARQRGLSTLFRLEDLDPDRCRDEFKRTLPRDIQRLGLDFDALVIQSDSRERHEQKLDELEGEGRLYPCRVSRRELKAQGLRAPDGSFRYSNAERERALPPGGWRESSDAIRLRLDDEPVRFTDGSGATLDYRPSEFGDPIVRRRDGAIAYQFASIVDDAAAGVTRVVRGRDLLFSTVVQVAMQRVLGYKTPGYHHHLLLVDGDGVKLSKLHGSLSVDAILRRTTPERLIGWLAAAIGLDDDARPRRVDQLTFDWDRVTHRDVEVVDLGEAESKPPHELL